jgi:hypothetical protein
VEGLVPVFSRESDQLSVHLDPVTAWNETPASQCRLPLRNTWKLSRFLGALQYAPAWNWFVSDEFERCTLKRPDNCVNRHPHRAALRPEAGPQGRLSRQGSCGRKPPERGKSKTGSMELRIISRGIKPEGRKSKPGAGRISPYAG